MSTKKLAVLVIVILLILVALLVWLKPKKTEAPTEPIQMASSVPQTRTYELTIADGKIASGPQTLKANQNDRIVMLLTADKNEEFDVTGYDVSADLAAGKQSTLVFTANTSGTFGLKITGSDTNLGKLEVAGQ